MRASGRLQLLLWGVRLRARKSSMLREFVRRVRTLAPDTRDRHLRGEVEFWRNWMLSEGLCWPDDYKTRFNPAAPVEKYLAEVVERVPGKHVELLDVGAGPVTAVGKVHPSKSISITATDVLAQEYNQLLDQLGLVPPVRTEFAETERLRLSLGPRQFDVVHAINTLDHSADPILGIEEMLAMTRPGGFVVLLHEENEGSKELYFALHKWDFTCRAGHFIIAGPGRDGAARDVNDLLSGRAEVECSLDDDKVLVVIRKAAAATAGSD